MATDDVKEMMKKCGAEHYQAPELLTVMETKIS
jgi:hypothetical protein